MPIFIQIHTNKCARLLKTVQQWLNTTVDEQPKRMTHFKIALCVCMCLHKYVHKFITQTIIVAEAQKKKIEENKYAVIMYIASDCTMDRS